MYSHTAHTYRHTFTIKQPIRLVFLVISFFIPLFILIGLSGYSQAVELNIELSKPDFVFDTVSAPVTLREANLYPQEQNLFNQIWPLLSEKKNAEALQIIESAAEFNNYQAAFSPAMKFLVGQIYLAQERYAQAETFFKSALEQMPDYIRVHEALGVLYLKLERYDEASPHLTKAVALGGASADLYANLGYLHQQRNKPLGAVAAYQNAMMLDYDNPQWQRGLLYALNQARHFSPALALTEELISKNTNDSSLWLYRAQIASMAGDNETALASLETAIRLGEDDIGNLQMCAQMHMRFGSIARAVSLLQKSFNQGMDFIYLEQSLAWLLQQNQLEFAQQLISAAKQNTRLSNDQKSTLLTHEAQLNLTKKQQDTAASLLAQAIELNSGNAPALLSLAKIHADKKNYSNAEIFYQRAAAYEEFKLRALMGQAQVALDQLNYASALKLLQQIRGENPQMYSLDNNIAILQNLISASP